MEIVLKVTEKEIIKKFAAELSVPEESIVLQIVKDAKRSPKHEIEEYVYVKPADENPCNTKYDLEEAEPQGDSHWFADWLDSHGITNTELSELTGISKSAIVRLRAGYWCRSTTFTKIVNDLGMTTEEAEAFKAGMVRHQKAVRREGK